jgi:hypothetical protein
MRKDEDDEASPTPGDLKPYEAPRLVEYGSIAKLTQGNRTVNNDAGAGFLSMMCL